MSHLLDIVYLILNFIQTQLRQSTNKKLQHETDEIENDPANWFSKHFGGGLHRQSKPKDKTSEADSTSDNER